MAHGLDMEIQFLPGVGPKRAELLRKELAVETVGDLLRLYPFKSMCHTLSLQFAIPLQVQMSYFL